MAVTIGLTAKMNGAWLQPLMMRRLRSLTLSFLREKRLIETKGLPKAYTPTALVDLAEVSGLILVSLNGPAMNLVFRSYLPIRQKAKGTLKDHSEQFKTV